MPASISGHAGEHPREEHARQVPSAGRSSRGHHPADRDRRRGRSPPPHARRRPRARPRSFASARVARRGVVPTPQKASRISRAMPFSTWPWAASPPARSHRWRRASSTKRDVQPARTGRHDHGRHHLAAARGRSCRCPGRSAARRSRAGCPVPPRGSRASRASETGRKLGGRDQPAPRCLRWCRECGSLDDRHEAWQGRWDGHGGARAARLRRRHVGSARRSRGPSGARRMRVQSGQAIDVDERGGRGQSHIQRGHRGSARPRECAHRIRSARAAPGPHRARRGPMIGRTEAVSRGNPTLTLRNGALLCYAPVPPTMASPIVRTERLTRKLRQPHGRGPGELRESSAASCARSSARTVRARRPSSVSSRARWRRRRGGSGSMVGRSPACPSTGYSRLGVSKSYQITNIFPHLTVLENIRVAAPDLSSLVQLLGRGRPHRRSGTRPAPS